MVVFTCNNCGESLKKQVVEKHKFACSSRFVSVSCMDCFKDFNESDYNQHVQCITELERYSGKDFVPKANQNKGQKKQEAWVDLVRSITEKKKTIPNGVKKILETISSYENIPRKKAKFLNFMKNSFRYMKVDELEEAWTLLEGAMNENKQANNENGKTNGNHITNGNGTNEVTEEVTNSNGTSEKSSKKRKLEENGNEVKEEIKKPKVEEENNEENEDELPTSTSRFSWSENIMNYLTTKNNEVTLKKLKGKIMKKYKNFTGTEWSDKIESKFNKKMNKLKGVIVNNDRVRLIQ